MWRYGMDSELARIVSRVFEFYRCMLRICLGRWIAGNRCKRRFKLKYNDKNHHALYKYRQLALFPFNYICLHRYSGVVKLFMLCTGAAVRLLAVFLFHVKVQVQRSCEIVRLAGFPLIGTKVHVSRSLIFSKTERHMKS